MFVLLLHLFLLLVIIEIVAMEDLISAIGASEAALLMVSCCIMGRPWAPVPSTAINISKKLIACRDGNQQIL